MNEYDLLHNFFCYILCMRTDDALPVVRKGSVDFTDSGERQTEYTYNTCGILDRCSSWTAELRSGFETINILRKFMYAGF